MLSTRKSRVTDRARIREIEAQIHLLAAEKDALRRRLDSYTYPVLMLPNEITSEIFRKSLPDYPHAPPPSGPGSPMVLTHVCRHWREIALSMPVLWRAISMDATADLISCWLERSGRKPLSIQISNMLDAVETSRFASLVPHHARWEHIQLRIESSQLPGLLRPMPLLRHIEIDVNEMPSDTRLTGVPLLRSAILWEFDFHTVFLPWSQLTALALISTTPEECTPILHQAPNLVYCELVLIGTVPVAQPDITLLSLERLTLTHFTFTEEPIPTGFLDCFVTPALKQLRIVDRLIVRPNALRSFIEKSGCQLQLQVICFLGRHSITTPQPEYTEQFPGIRVTFEKNLDQWLEEAETQARKMMMKRLRCFLVDIPLFAD
ncbi:hypothetical protein C8F01DRAFT_1101414 [Mycena amicta]|nr:hypothetical protein C8F01DRAFT_1101414 [Mycena amicta]